MNVEISEFTRPMAVEVIASTVAAIFIGLLGCWWRWMRRPSEPTQNRLPPRRPIAASCQISTLEPPQSVAIWREAIIGPGMEIPAERPNWVQIFNTAWQPTHSSACPQLSNFFCTTAVVSMAQYNANAVFAAQQNRNAAIGNLGAAIANRK